MCTTQLVGRGLTGCDLPQDSPHDLTRASLGKAGGPVDAVRRGNGAQHLSDMHLELLSQDGRVLHVLAIER